jgi:hypothetical protein
MRSSSLLAAALLIAAAAPSSRAFAQQQVQGFAVERFQSAVPGSAWLTSNDLALPEGLGGAASFTTGYARRPLRIDVPDGRPVDVVAHQAFVEAALAISYGRFRLSAFLPSPLALSGRSGVAGDSSYTAPDVNPSHTPDTIADPRVSLETILAKDQARHLRVGASAELVFPTSFRRHYLTDGTFRGIGRLLAAGNMDAFDYAASLGVHLRPLDDAPAPGSPRGSELVFGAAAAVRLTSGPAGTLRVGPELFGASAFRSFLASESTALEGLFGASLTRPMGGRMLAFLKLGAGAGLIPCFGAPEWRLVTSVGLGSR